MLRAIAFWLLATIILVTPAYAGLLKRGDREWIPRWIMFSGMALRFYDVRFEREVAGKRVLLDHYDWLGYAHWVDVPKHQRRLTSEGAARRMARQLCRKRTDGEPIYMRLRDATRRGWKVIDDGRTDVCAGAKRRRPKR